MSQEICLLLHPYPCAANSPSMLPLVIPGSQLLSSLCFTRWLYTVPVGACGARLQGWGRKKGLAPSCFPFLSLLLQPCFFTQAAVPSCSSPKSPVHGFPPHAERSYGAHLRDTSTSPACCPSEFCMSALLALFLCLIFANPGLLPAPHPALGWQLPTAVVPQCSLFTLSVTLLRILYLANKSSY